MKGRNRGQITRDLEGTGDWEVKAEDKRYVKELHREEGRKKG